MYINASTCHEDHPHGCSRLNCQTWPPLVSWNAMHSRKHWARYCSPRSWWDLGIGQFIFVRKRPVSPQPNGSAEEQVLPLCGSPMTQTCSTGTTLSPGCMALWHRAHGWKHVFKKKKRQHQLCIGCSKGWSAHDLITNLENGWSLVGCCGFLVGKAKLVTLSLQLQIRTNSLAHEWRSKSASCEERSKKDAWFLPDFVKLPAPWRPLFKEATTLGLSFISKLSTSILFEDFGIFQHQSSGQIIIFHQPRFSLK